MTSYSAEETYILPLGITYIVVARHVPVLIQGLPITRGTNDTIEFMTKSEGNLPGYLAINARVNPESLGNVYNDICWDFEYTSPSIMATISMLSSVQSKQYPSILCR